MEPGNKEKAKPKFNRRKEIINVNEVINEIETRNLIETNQ